MELCFCKVDIMNNLTEYTRQQSPFRHATGLPPEYATHWSEIVHPLATRTPPFVHVDDVVVV